MHVSEGTDTRFGRYEPAELVRKFVEVVSSVAEMVRRFMEVIRNFVEIVIIFAEVIRKKCGDGHVVHRVALSGCVVIRGV